MFEFFASLIATFLSLFGVSTADLQNDTQIAATYGSIKDRSVVAEVVSPPATSTHFLFTGDIMLARNVEELMERYGEAYPFSNISELTMGADITVGNFEAAMPVEHIKTPGMTFSFSVNETFLDRLDDAGFDYLSQANNHGYDYGYEGYVNAQEQIASHNISAFGHPRNIGTTTVSYLNVHDDHVVALIGVEAFSNSYTRTEVFELLDDVNERSDIQIVYIHWGDEYKLVHNQTQESIAKMFIEEGADLIVGHHPHVTQDIGLYQGVPIFYSLGNFVFDQYFSQDVQEGLVVGATYSGDSVTFDLIPVTSIGDRSVPREMAPYERDIFLRNLAARSDGRLEEGIRAGVFTVPLE